MRRTFLAMCFLLLAAFAVASTSTGDTQPVNRAPAIRTYLLPDLSLKSVISPDFLPQSQVPDVAANRRGFCRCSCGYPCTTSADCGGASCDPFITCCDKNPQDREWFTQALTQSSRKTPLPDMLLTANCK